MKPLIDLNSARAQQARLGRMIGRRGYNILVAAAVSSALLATVVAISDNLRYGLFLTALALACSLPAIWWKRHLAVLPPSGETFGDRLSLDVLANLKPGMSLEPRTVWTAISGHWQAMFLTHHLLLSNEVITAQLSTEAADVQHAFQIADQLAKQNNSQVVELVYLAAGLLLSSPGIQELLTQIKAQPGDIEAVANWLGRNLAIDHRKQNYGGIGRDWAFGFTPLLDRLGQNVSLAITDGGAYFGWLTKSEGVAAIEAAFNNHSGAVALIGPDGIGKTTSVYALAQRLIEGNTGPALAYHQVVTLNASDIVSRARGAGELEQIMIGLANEATRAGHIILFFDNAHLFFDDGHGSFDASPILLSILEARSLPIIMAFTPADFQRLKAGNQSLTSLMTPVMLKELPETGVMRVLEDTAISLENHHHVLVTYEAMHEAYRLSGRYEQDEAYPGKAIKLLENSISYSEHSTVNAVSVQKAIEQTHGVKVSSAEPAEADTLLNLEAKIHERMINQTHAVNVVASALRRSRAGVANPKRPIGSFLFLGPTGVGKTELAKAVASTYFGAENNMLRLDMSEYQQPEDVSRLLSDGRDATQSLILAVRQQPFSVVLLDEIEKAHPNILNLLLQLLDEGQLTDTAGRPVSFKDCIIIATSNAGAQTIRERVERGEQLESFQDAFTDELIKSGQFKPELLNRFDAMVLFRPLNQEELAQVVTLMMNEINQTLTTQNISVELTAAATAQIVADGYDPRLGARPMRRALQKAVEDTIAQKILKGEAKPGDHLTLDVTDLS